MVSSQIGIPVCIFSLTLAPASEVSIFEASATIRSTVGATLGVSMDTVFISGTLVLSTGVFTGAASDATMNTFGRAQNITTDDIVTSLGLSAGSRRSLLMSKKGAPRLGGNKNSFELIRGRGLSGTGKLSLENPSTVSSSTTGLGGGNSSGVAVGLNVITSTTSSAKELSNAVLFLSSNPASLASSLAPILVFLASYQNTSLSSLVVSLPSSSVKTSSLIYTRTWWQYFSSIAANIWANAGFISGFFFAGLCLACLPFVWWIRSKRKKTLAGKSSASVFPETSGSSLPNVNVVTKKNLNESDDDDGLHSTKTSFNQDPAQDVNLLIPGGVGPNSILSRESMDERWELGDDLVTEEEVLNFRSSLIQPARRFGGTRPGPFSFKGNGKGLRLTGRIAPTPQVARATRLHGNPNKFVSQSSGRAHKEPNQFDFERTGTDSLDSVLLNKPPPVRLLASNPSIHRGSSSSRLDNSVEILRASNRLRDAGRERIAQAKLMGGGGSSSFRSHSSGVRGYPKQR